MQEMDCLHHNNIYFNCSLKANFNKSVENLLLDKIAQIVFEKINNGNNKNNYYLHLCYKKLNYLTSVEVTHETKIIIKNISILSFHHMQHTFQDPPKTINEFLTTLQKLTLIRLDLLIAKQKFKRALVKIRQFFHGDQNHIKGLRRSYYCEAIDEKNRYGLYLRPFFDKWLNSSTVEESFNEWLTRIEKREYVVNSETLSCENLKFIPQVKYMNEEERKECQLKVENHLCTVNRNKLTSPLARFHIFVISPDDLVYVGLYERGKMHHSSFLAGNPISGGGKMILKNGKVEMITDKCGHYGIDQKRMYHSLKTLLSLGVDLSETKLILDAHTAKPKAYLSIFNFIQEFEFQKNLDDLSKDIRNHGPLSAKEAENILKDYRVGAALLRYHEFKNHFKISKKVGENEYQHSSFNKGLISLKKAMNASPISVKVLIPPN